MNVDCRYKKCIRNAVYFILSFYLLKKERKTDKKQKNENDRRTQTNPYADKEGITGGGGPDSPVPPGK